MSDCATYSLMVGLGETYFAAYALALGAGEVAVGLIATTPMLSGAILQLLAPAGVRWIGSHKRWVVLCAALQASSLLLLPLAWPAPVDWVGWAVFAAAVCYWAAGLATGPAWNTWIEDIVPPEIRTRFFARRSRIGQACVLAAFASAGVALHFGQQAGRAPLVFCAMFLLAAACRFLSAGFLARQSASKLHHRDERSVGLRELFDRTRGDVGGALVFYLLAVQAAVQISGPFFTPYILGRLEFSYFAYMVLIGIGFIGKIVALPLWGRFAHAAGPRKLLWIGGLGITPVAGLWCFSHNFWYLCLVQTIAGVVWAAFELAMMLMFFEAIPRRERTSVLTFYNVGNAGAMVAGGLLGAFLLQNLGGGMTAYWALFALSSLARAATLVFLVRAPKATFEPTPIATRTVAVHADGSGLERPILPSLPEQLDNPPPVGDTEARSAPHHADDLAA